MANILIVLTLLSLPLTTIARADEGFCGSYAVAVAQQSLAQTQSRHKVGLVTPYQLLMAEKLVLDLKYCNDPFNSDVFDALAANSLSRLDVATKAFNAGVLASINVSAIRNEKQGLYIYCSTELIAKAERRLNFGLMTPRVFLQLKQACDSLE